MGRPIQYDRETVIAQATDLFWRKGYEATTLDDIFAATGFNRHSLYRAFGNKDGLFLAALQHYEQNFTRLIGAALESEAADLDALRGLFTARFPADLAGLGCLMTNTLNEAATVPEEAGQCAQRFLFRLEAGLRNVLERAQTQGDIPADKDCGALAKYILYVIQGIGTMSKVGFTEADAEAVVRQTLAFIKQPASASA